MNTIVPISRTPLAIRTATMADLPFMDALQKKHTKQVGWMPTKQLEGKIASGHVIMAEEVAGCQLLVASGEGTSDAGSPAPLPVTSNQQLATPLGYCIGHDQYFKRDDVGIIYQMNVVPDRQRGLIGATLVKAMFDRAAYGCRLFCCWCAQDIEANHFWESLGFIPLAFRAGSRSKGRVHIFWERRIRAGDTTTPYWFPSQTTSGSIREDRLVLPIPPGTHWRDAKPLLLPELARASRPCLPAKKQKDMGGTPMPLKRTAITAGGLRFVVPKESAPQPKREPKPKVKNDPTLVAAARELRDRWLEQVNAPGRGHLSFGKYDVSRILSEAEGSRALRGPTIPVPSATVANQPTLALPAPAAA